MKITSLQAPSFEASVVDAAFGDEETLLFTTSSAELWRAVMKPESPRAERVLDAGPVLGPVAQALGEAMVSPARGGYPRLAVSYEAGVAVVNTHDVVLVACPLRGAGAPQLVWCGWGQYYPSLAFSPDGSRLMASADEVILFDTASWRSCLAHGGARFCAWHPREPRLLCLEPTRGELHWWDVQDVDRPRRWLVGMISTVPFDDHVVGIAIDVTGDRFVVAYRCPDRIEWWRLDPLRRDGVKPLSSEILALEHGRRAALFATVTGVGAQIWSFESQEPIEGVIPSVDEIKFSPSGLRFATLRRRSTNPYPGVRDRTEHAPALWGVISD